MRSRVTTGSAIEVTYQRRMPSGAIFNRTFGYYRTEEAADAAIARLINGKLAADVVEGSVEKTNVEMLNEGVI